MQSDTESDSIMNETVVREFYAVDRFYISEPYC